MEPTPRFSIVVPMRDEAANVAALAAEIAVACTPLGPFEAIFVDDGSTDDTALRLRVACRDHPWLRALHHARPAGQSAALRSGVLAARAPLICTLDGDGQNPPAEVPRLLSPFLDPPLEDAGPPLGLVAGERRDRADPWPRRLASRLANRLRAALLGDGARDSGCGMRAFPREVFLALPYFDHMHRFLPALVRREGLGVRYVAVAHRRRLAGTSKYGLAGRAIAGALDLAGVWWLLHRRRLPGTVTECTCAAEETGAEAACAGERGMTVQIALDGPAAIGQIAFRAGPDRVVAARASAAGPPEETPRQGEKT